MTNYKATVTGASRKLTSKEKIALINGMGAIGLDAATQVEDVVINPDFYAVVSIHNEKSENKDYENFYVVDKDGTAYVTSSSSFMDTFINIFEAMEQANSEMVQAGETPEAYEIVAYRRESKNYKGKTFITCKIR